MSENGNRRGSLFDPRNWPDHLRQRKQRDPNGDNSARDVQDPHKWEDPDASLREKITPDTTGQWLALLSGVLIIGGIILYLYPVFGQTFQDPLTLATTGLLASFIIVYLKGRQDGINAYIHMAKSFVYYGNEFDFRLGKHQGEKGNRTLFTPYVDLSYGGFNPRELKKRDLPYDASKVRSNIEDDAGEEPVVDRLNATTVTKDIPNFGKVHFTHADDLKHDEFGQYSDRYTSLPTELDEDVVDNVHELIDSLEHNIKHLQQQVELYEESNEELRSLKESQTAPQLKETLQLLMMLKQAMPGDRRRSDDTDLDFENPYDQLMEEVNE